MTKRWYCPQHPHNILDDKWCGECAADERKWVEECKFYEEAWKVYGSELAYPRDKPWTPGLDRLDREEYIRKLHGEIEKLEQHIKKITIELDWLTNGKPIESE